jgi:hypothetical protein
VIDIPTLFNYLYVVSGATLRKEDDSYNSPDAHSRISKYQL